ncbi:MAG TPA: hypothetical protein ENJ95_19595 [Bacteroidetes bacterium]|nr:hypothetical protein [Bacteroidota bacterium]
MKKRILKILVLFFVLSFSAPAELPAQCPMCKIAAESNLKNGGSAGSGLNTGILFLFFMPYILVGAMGYIWWKNRKQDVDEIF